jgi:hypothetical protein
MDTNTLKEYLKIHIISLKQDLDQLEPTDERYSYVEAQIEGYTHILEIVNG